jgi:hypothetical protein
MKIKLLSLFTIILSVTNAQNLTLTKSGYEPVIGDKKGTYALDTSFYSTGLPSNITGTAVTWDFSNLILNPTVTLNSSDYVAPASTTVTPPAGATIAEDQNGSYNFYKSVSTPSTQYELQSVKFGTLSLTFTNTAIVARWPISYGYSLTDAIGGSVTFSLPATFTGSVTTVADGMGTLLMPQSNTFSNVLRVKSVQTIAVNVFIIGNIANVKQTTYQYYHSSSKFPILTVNNSSTTFSTSPPAEVTSASGNANFLAIGVKENSLNAFNFNVFPNPASNAVNVELPKGQVAESITLINSIGQTLKSKNNSNVLNVSDIPNGVYYLEVRSGDRSSRKPVVINH